MNSTPRAQFLIAWMIWAAFMSGLVGLLLLVQFQQDTLGAVLEPKFSILWSRTLCYFFVIVLFPMIGGIKKRLNYKPTRTAAAPGGSLQTSPSRNISVGRLILPLALAEIIGILGFILFLLGDTLQTLYIFVGLSALAMLLHRPLAEEYI